MLRAAVVDAAGNVNDSAVFNISFAVTAGPGRVLATHNGDNACHEPNHASWHSSYAGLVRGIVQVTQHHAGPPRPLSLMMMMMMMMIRAFSKFH